MRNCLKITTATLLLAASPAAAEMELTFYLGSQTVENSNGSGTMPGGVPVNRNFGWQSKPGTGAIYYGGRAIWWTSNNLGFGAEGTHAKAFASNATLAAIGADSFEFSDGHNILTVNLMKRWPDAFGGQRFTPYIGGGIGIAVPSVDIRVTGASNRTFRYETTGLALRGIVGVKYDLNPKWALFGEYQITWSDNDVTVDADPLVVGQADGKISTEIVTHALNVGISYSF